MGHVINGYVATCAQCPRIKVAQHKPYGKLQSLLTPEGPWSDLTVDFITGLPPSGHRGHAYDAILVVMDCFTKIISCIATTKRVDPAGLADLFMEQIVCPHGAPHLVVSDIGTVFTAQIWSAVCYHAQIRCKLSTAFYHQTDSQTEQQNQMLSSICAVTSHISKTTG
jgi:putative transposase